MSSASFAVTNASEEISDWILLGGASSSMALGDTYSTLGVTTRRLCFLKIAIHVRHTNVNTVAAFLSFKKAHAVKLFLLPNKSLKLTAEAGARTRYAQNMNH
jgi:hypothetical protein